MNIEPMEFDPHKMSQEEWDNFSDLKEHPPYDFGKYYSSPLKKVTKAQLEEMKFQAAQAGRKMDVEKVLCEMGYEIVDELPFREPPPDMIKPC
jgi:hypothetical protein